MSKLVCGPFESEGPLYDMQVTFHISTNADWVKHPEGQATLLDAISGLERACGEGRLPNDLRVQWFNKDEAKVTIPLPKGQHAILIKDSVVKKVLEITGAAEAETRLGTERNSGPKALVCGPFSAVKGTKGTQVVIPVFVQGSAAKTEEGVQLLHDAARKLHSEADALELPESAEFDFITENNAVLRIPCNNYPEAEMRAKHLKKTLPTLLNAAVLSPTKETDIG